MSKPLLFPSEEALQVALTSGLVPPELQASEAGIARGKDGSIRVFPTKVIAKAVGAKLTAAGVGFGDGKPVRTVRCWAEALSTRRFAGAEPSTGMVLFAVPRQEDLLALGAEMLRLGCDRQDFAFDGAGKAGGGVAGLLRAVDPPYFTLASVMDGAGTLASAVRAFVPSPPGQERVWIEVGYGHPLASTVKAPAGELLLIPGEGEPWTTVGDGPWTNLYQVLELQLPGGRSAPAPVANPKKLPVKLRLARATRAEAPTLWVLRDDALASVDAMVRNLSDEVLSRLLFAVAEVGGGSMNVLPPAPSLREGEPDVKAVASPRVGETDVKGVVSPPLPTGGGRGEGALRSTIVVLKARAGRQAPPELVVPGQTFVSLMQIADVFVPHDAIVEPPLRRERLRELLAPEPGQVVWLAPREGGSFTVESLPDTAFHPLAEWVEYVIHRDAARLEPWSRGATFDFDAFESVGVEWAEAPPKEKEEPAKKERPTPTHRSTREAPRADEPRAPVSTVAPSRIAESQVEYRLVPTSQDETRLLALQRAFVDSTAAADDGSRVAQWMEMGTLNAQLNRARDAGLCWTRGVWELSGADAADAARRWAVGEAHLVRQPDLASTVKSLLDRKTPSREETRALAACVVLGALDPDALPAIRADVHRVQVWLDAHDEDLDVRTLWLARGSLAKLVGGDRLGLARTRDRVLAKLHRGLSVERDVPTFLRFLGQGGNKSEAGASARLVEVLETVLEKFEKTERKRSAVEAPPALTKLYVHCVFAYGFARLGASERARALRDAAIAGLNLKDPIHGFLSRAYSARIEVALEGLPVETPLPQAVAGELDALEKFLRYKVDRLRQISPLLEPHERLDPVQAFQRGERDPRGEEFAGMRGMTDPGKLSEAIDKLLRHAMAEDTKPEESARLFDGLMDFFPVLPEAEALPKLIGLLRAVDDIPAPRRALLLEEALMLAGYFGREDLVKQILGTLKRLFRTLGPEHAAEVGGMLGRCLRSLRRVGLRDDAAELLDTISKVVIGTGVPALAARLHLAAGLAYLGHLDRAKPAFAEAQDQLSRADLSVPDRLTLTRAMATALSQTPQDFAVAGIVRLVDHLKVVTDSFNTNSHFCLSVLHFVESLVMGLASEDLALGEFGRRWLDEDEYLVRRRVHRELGEHTS